MSNPTPPTLTSLHDARLRFIEVWGNMASNWGISKTMAQVYALLYASPDPLDTDAIMQQLDVSRGNANMNLHKLLEWGLISKIDKQDKDTRKDLFRAEKDVWQLTLRVVQERSEKEVKPVVRYLQEISSGLGQEADGRTRPLTPQEEEFRSNLNQMVQFLGLFEALTQKMLPLLENRSLKQINTLLDFLTAAAALSTTDKDAGKDKPANR
jgi:DNA-binding transcriptional regulator GbsR (MarR family)